MTLRISDRVWDITTTIGTGNAALQNTPPNAYQSFGSVCSNNDTIYYAIANTSANEWEVGLGTFSSVGPALARTQVLASSNAGAIVAFSSGTKNVMGVFPASQVQNFSNILTSANFSVQTSTYTLTSNDDGKIVTVNSSAACNLFVPTGLSSSFSCTLLQLGAGQVTIAATSTSTAAAAVNSFNSTVNLAGQYASASLFATASNTFVLTGTLV